MYTQPYTKHNPSVDIKVFLSIEGARKTNEQQREQESANYAVPQSCHWQERRFIAGPRNKRGNHSCSGLCGTLFWLKISSWTRKSRKIVLHAPFSLASPQPNRIVIEHENRALIRALALSRVGALLIEWKRGSERAVAKVTEGSLAGIIIFATVDGMRGDR